MPRKHNSGRHGNGRRYIMNAILQALPDDKSMYSRDLVEEVSQLSGKPVSSYRIGQHMSMLEEEGLVRRIGEGAKRVWKKTWRGGANPSKVLNMTKTYGMLTRNDRILPM